MKIIQTSLVPKNKEWVFWVLFGLTLVAFASKWLERGWFFDEDVIIQLIVTLLLDVLLGAVFLWGRQIGKSGQWYLWVDEKGIIKFRPGLFRNPVTMCKVDFHRCLSLERGEDVFLGTCLRADMAFGQRQVLIPIGQYEKTPEEILAICREKMAEEAAEEKKEK